MISKLNFKIPSSFKTQDLSWMFDVLHQVQSGISISDAQKPDMPLIFVNKGFQEMTGYSSEEVVGKNCRFLQGQERDQTARETIRKAIQQATSCEVVLRNFKKDGALFYNRLILSPVFDNDKKLTHFIGIQNDITQQLLRESEIESQRLQNEKLSKLASLGELSSAIVHEINSPMMILMSQIDIIKNSSSKLDGHDELKNAASKCEMAYDRVVNIIKSLRSFSHEGTNYVTEKLDVVEVINETLELCLPRLKGTPIHLEFKASLNEFFGKMHRTQFSQVLINLFNNACDAIESSLNVVKSTIQIRVSKSDQQIFVDLIDSGSGVPVEIRELMFESFFTTKEQGKGTGLGLSLSKKFCQRMSGDLIYCHEKDLHYFRIILPRQ